MTCALVPLNPNELTPARRGASPRGQARPSAVDRHRVVGPGDVRARRREVQVRRDALVLQRQHDLDDAGHAGRRLEVADVGLDRADRQRRVDGAARRRARRPERRTSIGSPSGCRCRGPRRSRCRRGASRASASAARITASCAGPFGTVSPPLRPSWLTARAADDGQDAVAVGRGVGQPLQHQRRRSPRRARSRRRPRRRSCSGRRAPACGPWSGRSSSAASTSRSRRRPAPAATRRCAGCWQARCSATSDDEHAVSTDSAGPCRPRK